MERFTDRHHQMSSNLDFCPNYSPDYTEAHFQVIVKSSRQTDKTERVRSKVSTTSWVV